MADYNILSKELFLQDLQKYQQAYSEGKPFITDEEYENLVELYEERFNEPVFDPSTQLEANTSLPCKLPGIKKVYTIKKELRDFQGAVITSKLDGVSCLLIKEGDRFSLFTKGSTDLTGRNISNILPKLNIPLHLITPDSIKIRGELIIPKAKQEPNTPLRSQAIGLLNRKDADVSKIDLIAYQVLGTTLTAPEQLELLQSFNFKVVKHIFTGNDIAKDLPNIYAKFKAEEEYEIDGLVIYEATNPLSFLEKTDYVFAFKQNTLFAETEVIDIQWSKSKQGRFVPVIYVAPVTFREYKINKVSGYNARYLKNAGIGIGSRVVLEHAGDVIPVIRTALTKSDDLPAPEVPYNWNGTDYISLERDVAQEIKNYINLYKIKGIGDKTIDKYIGYLEEDSSIDDIFSFLDALNKAFATGKPLGGPKTDTIFFNLSNILYQTTIDLKSLIRAKNGLRKTAYAKISDEDLLNLTEDENVKFFLDNREKFETTFNIL